MEISAKSLIDKAFLISGITAQGDVNSNGGVETDDALLTLNSILNSWKIDRLLNVTTTQVDKLVSTPSFTVGPSGDLVTQRPAKILSAFIRQPAANGNLDTPLQIIEYLKWDAISLPNNNSTIPLKLYYEPTSPDGTVHLWPIPQGDVHIFLRFETQIGEYATINDVLELTPGFILALQYNLADHLCVQYGISRPDIMQKANEALAVVQRQNVRINTLFFDRRMPTGRRFFGLNNINTGYGY